MSAEGEVGGARHARPTGGCTACVTYRLPRAGRRDGFSQKDGAEPGEGLDHGGAHASERTSRCLSRAAGEGGEAATLAESGCWAQSPNMSPRPSPSVGSSPEVSTCHSRNSRVPLTSQLS